MRSPGPQGPQATPTPRYWEFHPVAASPGSLGCCPVPWLDECPVFICVGKWPHIDNYWHMPRLGGRNHYLKFLFCLTILGGSGYWHIWFIMMANMILLGFLEFPFPHLRSISETARYGGNPWFDSEEEPWCFLGKPWCLIPNVGFPVFFPSWNSGNKTDISLCLIANPQSAEPTFWNSTLSG